MVKRIPAYKKGRKTEITNYKPISLLLNISKIIEIMVHGRLDMFLEKK